MFFKVTFIPHPDFHISAYGQCSASVVIVRTTAKWAGVSITLPLIQSIHKQLIMFTISLSTIKFTIPRCYCYNNNNMLFLNTFMIILIHLNQHLSVRVNTMCFCLGVHSVGQSDPPVLCNICLLRSVIGLEGPLFC